MKDQVLDFVRYVSALSAQRDKILQATGEKFNIFRVLNLSTSETRTHSAFLAELFNPKGSHGQGSVFLKLFVEQLGIKDFDFKSANVEIEKFAGYIDADYREGGRIDIVITDNNGQGIIIENKIYAGDQKKVRFQISWTIGAEKEAKIMDGWFPIKTWTTKKGLEIRDDWSDPAIEMNKEISPQIKKFVAEVRARQDQAPTPLKIS